MPGALEFGLRRLDEVGGAADHRRRERLQRLHHLACPRRAWPRPRPPGTRAAPRASPRAARRVRSSSRSRASSGKAAAQAASRSSHSRCALGSALAHDGHVLAHGSETANVASGSKPIASFVARTSASPSGAPCAFAVSIACGAGIGDVAADDDQRRPLLLRLRRGEGAEERVEVLGVVDVLDVPAVCLEALAPCPRS